MSVPAAVAINGEGVAAVCCHQLLKRQGATVTWTMSSRSRVPAVMLSDAALALLRDCLERPDLFADRPRITRRVVVWGTAEPVVVPHQAVMLGADDFNLGEPGCDALSATPGLTIHTANAPVAEEVLRFGKRSATIAPVRLLLEEDRDACWVEATDNGWLFMVPSSGNTGWLLAIGAPGVELLRQCRHLSKRIEIEPSRTVAFDTSPRLRLPMAKDDWLSCGSASMAFDPICGDGTAMAAKQAILASTVALAMHDGEDADDLRGHYQAMMVATMRRHLRLCSEFYATGGDSPWWRAQQQALVDGFVKCSALLECEPAPRFALEGYRLLRRDQAA